MIDVLTLREVHNELVGGESETENTWFKGYAWTAMSCGCGEHLGWRFTASSPSLQPDSFYGILRSAIEWH